MALKSNFFASFVVRFAVFLYLFESLVSLFFAVAGLRIFQGKVDFPSLPEDSEELTWWKQVSFLVYIRYFNGHGPGQSVECPTVIYPPTAAAYRTYIWVLIYLGVSSLWMITSLFLFFAVLAKNKVTGSIQSCFCYPWLLTTVTVILIDAYATITYLQDLIVTSGTVTHLRTEYSREIELIQLQTSGDYDVLDIPPVIMSLIFLRGGVFWILNIVLASLIIGILRSQLRRERSESESTLPVVSFRCIVNQKNGVPDEDTLSQVTTTSTEVSSSLRNNQDYVPWMNVFYIPSYTEFNDTGAIAEGDEEHGGYEHHYERVVCPHDLPSSINIQEPTTVTTDPQLCHLAGYYNTLACSEPQLLKIDCGSISIHIKSKQHPLALSSNYLNIPKIHMANLGSVCTAANCNVHKDNHTSPTS